MRKKSVLIVGAGVSGMATAIILAKNGFDVTVFEKNSHSGGRCGQILRDGHRFDIGATLLLMPSIYRTVFDSLGLNFDECFDLKDLSVPPSNRLEKLKGHYADYHSIRINDQWRIIFKWSKGSSHNVEIIDYH